MGAQNQKPAWISRDHFVNRLHAALEQRRRKVARERSEHLLPVPAEDVGKEHGRPFVRQLHLITEDDGVVDGAIKDFIRCNLEKLHLCKEGNITDDDWLAFDSALRSRWNRIQARVKRNSGAKSEQDQGWEIFSDTIEDHREKLAGQDTEQVYLTAGTYQPCPAPAGRGRVAEVDYAVGADANEVLLVDGVMRRRCEPAEDVTS